MNLRVALDLHHLDQALEVAAQARVIGRDRLAGVVERLEHQALAAVRVVRNRQQPRAFLLLLGHPGPEFLLVGAVERRERHVGDVEVTEDDVAMHVPGLRRGGPFVACQRRELAGPVVVDRGLDLDVLPGAARGLGTSVERRVTGVRAAVVFDDILQEPCALLVNGLEVAQLLEHRIVAALGTRDLRRVHLADELGVVGDGNPVERPADVVLLAVHDHVTALRELVGLVRRDPRTADVCVERVGRVHVRLAEVRVLERVLRDRGLELLDRWRRGGGRRGCGCRRRCGVLRCVATAAAPGKACDDRTKQRRGHSRGNMPRGVRIGIHGRAHCVMFTACTRWASSRPAPGASWELPVPS